MISRLGIAIVLSLLMLSGPAWAGICSAEFMRPLVSCLVADAEKNPTTSGSFEQLYQVRNNCDYYVDVVIQFSEGDDVIASLGRKEVKEEILPEGVEVTGFYCCSPFENCESAM